MRCLLLMVLANALVFGGCSDDTQGLDGGTDGGTDGGATDTDTDVDTDCPQGEYSGDFEILEQSDVTTLAGYTSISGTLHIECPSCTDLSELVCLTSVFDLWIGNNATLAHLDGLNSITSVGGSLAVNWNGALTNLDELSVLASLGGRLQIEYNPALTNLDGLSGITSVGDYLNISGNGALTNLDGLSGITSVGGNSWIQYNMALTNLDGLAALTSVAGDLLVYFNTALPDCEACDLLDQLTVEPTSIEVHDNLGDSCTPVPDNCP